MQNNKSEIGISYTDELSSQLLSEQWKEIYKRIPVNISKNLLNLEFDKIGLFDYNQKLGLTLLFMNNWLNSLEDLQKEPE